MNNDKLIAQKKEKTKDMNVNMIKTILQRYLLRTLHFINI